MENSFVNYSMDEVMSLIECGESIVDVLISEVVEDLQDLHKRTLPVG